VLADAAGEHHEVDIIERGAHPAERAPQRVRVHIERERCIGFAGGTPFDHCAHIGGAAQAEQAARALETILHFVDGEPALDL